MINLPLTLLNQHRPKLKKKLNNIHQFLKGIDKDRIDEVREEIINDLPSINRPVKQDDINRVTMLSNLLWAASKSPADWKFWFAAIAYGYFQKGELSLSRAYAAMAGEKQFLDHLKTKGPSESVQPYAIALDLMLGIERDHLGLELPDEIDRMLIQDGDMEPEIGHVYAMVYDAFQQQDKAAMLEAIGLAAQYSPEFKTDDNLLERPGYDIVLSAIACLMNLPAADWSTLDASKQKVIGPALFSREETTPVLPPYLS